ncbi:CPBP family intramembrane glutamic endopeptidase [Thermopolyspora sp. NPDC052614]|uniref:CPBP family intramembrane glutamic endopeptidase n=1 Tax=Thermopolyspora sp. NPDC052614 TaxID=3155682 RepID=UPI0034338DC0
MLGTLAILTTANVLNNRVAPRLAPLTSATATVALIGLARRSGLSWRELGFERGRRGALLGAALTLGGVVPVYAVGVVWPRTRPLFLDKRALSLSRARLAEEILLQVPIGTVLLEEVGFRGVVHGLVARSHGRAAATAVSSALFGLWHVLPALDMARANSALSGETFIADNQNSAVRRAVGAVAGTVVATAAAGVLLCALRRRGGLLAPAMLHTATNSLGFFAARIARRLTR